MVSASGYLQAERVPIPPERLSELRIAVQQSYAGPPTAAGPRRLTAEERAELRRQVLEQSLEQSRKPGKS